MTQPTTQDYQTLGRIHGASQARVLCGDFFKPTSAEIEAANNARCDRILENADKLNRQQRRSLKAQNRK